MSISYWKFKLKYDKGRTALSRVNFQEDINVSLNEAKIIYKATIKMCSKSDDDLCLSQIVSNFCFQG